MINLFKVLRWPSFSPQPSAAVKIKDGGYNFSHENTEQSLAKNTLTLHASYSFNHICKYIKLPLQSPTDLALFVTLNVFFGHGRQPMFPSSS